MKNRLILSVKKSGLPQFKNGFNGINYSEIIEILTNSGLWIGPREDLETNEDFFQIIPYVVLVKNGKIVKYSRTTSSGESRLHGKISIGIDGHVDLEDILNDSEGILLSATLYRAAEREVKEELNVRISYKNRPIGLLVDDSTAVNKVHIGLVSIWELENDLVSSNEDALGQVEMAEIKDLDENMINLETWSAQLIPHLKTIYDS